MELLTRSSHQRSVKKAALKIFAIFTGKHLCWSLFLIKLQSFRHCNFIKKDFNTEVFSRENCEIPKNTYFEKHLFSQKDSIIDI